MQNLKKYYYKSFVRSMILLETSCISKTTRLVEHLNKNL